MGLIIEVCHPPPPPLRGSMRSSQCQNQRTFGATHYTKGRMLLALRRSDRAEYVPSMLVELTTRPGLRLASGKRGVWPADWLAQAGSLAWLPPRYHERSTHCTYTAASIVHCDQRLTEASSTVMGWLSADWVVSPHQRDTRCRQNDQQPAHRPSLQPFSPPGSRPLRNANSECRRASKLDLGGGWIGLWDWNLGASPAGWLSDRTLEPWQSHHIRCVLERNHNVSLSSVHSVHSVLCPLCQRVPILPSVVLAREYMRPHGNRFAPAVK